ncbi:unnamed protein product [Schistosoma margrebowiei]|uniref:long-chain-fatty-acid--CoA ligase n=1 Tax=Schistosoma margrebowiei TaxID=48269 RepID=A0AA84ZAN5_9TREM|nr:unnamed protein product [Schistosoma margrebowiei]CAH8666035.1 unnamed protein product [Schistosoma margrebowiei]
MPDKRSTYPNSYEKYSPLDRSRSFISVHLNQQSIISDPKTGARKSPISQKFTDESRVQTIKDIFEYGLNNSRSNRCLGKRPSFNDPYSWLTYDEVDERIRAIGSALSEIVKLKHDCENFVGIYAPNSPEWVIMQHACAAYSYTIVPLYPTLGDEALQHILSQTKMNCVLCASGREALHLMDKFESSLEILIIIANDSKFEEVKSRYSSKVSIYLFEELMKLGLNKLLPKKNPLPTDLYMISYTSGSTGLPKGVLIRHKEVTCAVIGLHESSEFKIVNSNSVHLSYLPLPHIMEQVAMSSHILMGACSGFLTESIDGLLDDAYLLRPTSLVVVPRVLSRMYTKYQSALGDSVVKKKLYNYIVNKKLAEQKRGKFNHRSFVDTLLFGKLRKKFGGRVCCVVSGSAPLSPELSKFAHAVFNVVFEGYGTTETMGGVTLSPVGEYRLGTVGGVVYGVELKLVDVPDLGLVALRDGRGEICARGDQCSKGYFKDPVKTAELIDSDGWVHTGDIGEWTEEGSLKIVDRVKSIFKLAQGEYIAPEKIEMAYQTCKLISQIFVDGNSQKNYPVAIVVPDFTELRSALSNSKVLQHHKKLLDSELCRNETVNKFVLEKMNGVATLKLLKGFEKVQAIYLTDEAFTVDNGLLTPTMKLSRNKARNYFSKTIISLYTQHELNSSST